MAAFLSIPVPAAIALPIPVLRPAISSIVRSVTGIRPFPLPSTAAATAYRPVLLGRLMRRLLLLGLTLVQGSRLSGRVPAHRRRRVQERAVRPVLARRPRRQIQYRQYALPDTISNLDFALESKSSRMARKKFPPRKRRDEMNMNPLPKHDSPEGAAP